MTDIAAAEQEPAKRAESAREESEHAEVQLSPFGAERSVSLEGEADDASDLVVNGGLRSGGRPGRRRATSSTPRLQREALPGDDPTATADAASHASAETPVAGVLIDDDIEPLPGQMRRSDFLERGSDVVCRAADDELAQVGQDTSTCPYVAHWLARFEGYDARRLERAVVLYSSPTTDDVDGYLVALDRRVRAAVRTWIATGEVELPEGVSGPLATTEPMSLQRSSLPGAPKSGNAPGPAMRSLGPGRALDGTARHRMERAYGESFGGVRVHSDQAAARLSRSERARAFTVGDNVVFGAGEYQPESLAGQALLAHELAHVVQQRGGGAAREDAAAEREADDAVASIVTDQPGQITRRGGLALRRCSEPNSEIPRNMDPDQLGVWMQDEYGVQVTRSPIPENDDPYLVGQRVSIDWDTDSGFGTSISTTWTLTSPSGHDTSTMKARPAGGGYTLNSAGRYELRLRIFMADGLAGGFSFNLYDSWEVETAATRATRRAGEMEPEDYESFRSNQELQMALLRPGTPLEQVSGSSAIYTIAANPTTVSDADAPGWNTYGIVSQRGSASFHWYARPLSWDGIPDPFHGLRKVTAGPSEALDLGTGDEVRLPTSVASVFVIECHEFDEHGTKLGQATYLQTILSSEDRRQMEKLEESIRLGDRRIAQISTGQRVAIHAVHVSGPSGQVFRPRLFIGRKRGDANRFLLVDLTPGLDPEQHTLTYEGSSVAAALADLDERNRYPEGALSYDIPENDANVPTSSGTMQTDGASFWQELSGGFGIASLLLGIGALVAAPFTGGGSLLVLTLTVGAIGAGVTAGALSIVARLETEDVDEQGVAIDVLSIAAALLGARPAMQAARGAAPVMLASRSTRYLLISAFVTESVAFLLIAEDSIEKIIDVLDSNLNPDAKRAALVRIVTQLIVTGALLAVSYSSLAGVRNRVNGNLKAGVPRQLDDQARFTLNMLDDATLAQLRRAEIGEVNTLVAVLRTDPTFITRVPRGALREILRGASGGTLAALEASVMSHRMTALGIGGGRAEALSAAITDAGLPLRVATELPDDSLRSLARAEAAFASGDMTAAVRRVDELSASLSAQQRSRIESTMAQRFHRPDPAQHRQALAQGGGGSGPLRWQLDPSVDLAPAVGDRARFSDALRQMPDGLRTDVLGSHPLQRALVNGGYAPQDLIDAWGEYARRGPGTTGPGRRITSPTFEEYITRHRGFRTAGGTRLNPDIVSVFPNWGTMQSPARARALMGQTHAELLAAIGDPASTLSASLRTRINHLITDSAESGALLNNATKLDGATSTFARRFNERLGREIANPGELTDVLAHVPSSNQGSIGEWFAHFNLMSSAERTSASSVRHAQFTQAEVPGLSVQNFNPDRLDTSAHQTLDLKTGYHQSAVETSQVGDYDALVRASSTVPAVRTRLGGPLRRHNWLFQPATDANVQYLGQTMQPSQAAAARHLRALDRSLTPLERARQRVFYLDSSGQIHELVEITATNSLRTQPVGTSLGDIFNLP